MDAVLSAVPTPVLIGAGVIVALVILVRLHASGTAQDRPRDPQRMFTAGQRTNAFGYAGGRCEMSGFLGARCTRNAHHADHFWPWSKGGASSAQNLVAACSFHNLAKGARMPSALAKSRIESRRARYWPAGLPRTAGEWYR